MGHTAANPQPERCTSEGETQRGSVKVRVVEGSADGAGVEIDGAGDGVHVSPQLHTTGRPGRMIDRESAGPTRDSDMYMGTQGI